MYSQIWYHQKSDQWNELIYPINHTFIIIQLIISLHIMCSVTTCSPWTWYVMSRLERQWRESTDSHHHFKSAFLLVRKAGTGVLAGNTQRRSFCHHTRRSPSRNELQLPRDDRGINTRQQMDRSNYVGHSSISWHSRIFWNTFHGIHFRRAHQITA